MESFLEINPCIMVLDENHCGGGGNSSITQRLSGSLEPLTLPSMLSELRTLLHVHMPDPVWRNRSLELVQSIELACLGSQERAANSAPGTACTRSSEFAISPMKAIAAKVMSPRKESLLPTIIDTAGNASDGVACAIDTVSIAIASENDSGAGITKDARQLRSKKTVKLKTKGTSNAESKPQGYDEENKVISNSVADASNRSSKRRTPLGDVSASVANKETRTTQSSPTKRPQEKITYYMSSQSTSEAPEVEVSIARNESSTDQEEAGADTTVHLVSNSEDAMESSIDNTVSSLNTSDHSVINAISIHVEEAPMQSGAEAAKEVDSSACDVASKPKKGSSRRRKITAPIAPREEYAVPVVDCPTSTTDEVVLSFDAEPSFPDPTPAPIDSIAKFAAEEITVKYPVIEESLQMDGFGEEEEEVPKRQPRKKANSGKRRKSVAPLSFIHRVDDDNIDNEPPAREDSPLGQASGETRVLNKGMAFLSMDIDDDIEFSLGAKCSAQSPEPSTPNYAETSPQVCDIELQSLCLDTTEVMMDETEFDESAIRDVWSALEKSDRLPLPQFLGGYGAALLAALSNVSLEDLNKIIPLLVDAFVPFFSEQDLVSACVSENQPTVDPRGKRSIRFASGSYFGDCISPPNDRVAESINSMDAPCEEMVRRVEHVQLFTQAFSSILQTLPVGSQNSILSALSMLATSSEKSKEVLSIVQSIEGSVRKISSSEVRQLTHAAELLMVELEDQLGRGGHHLDVMKPIQGEIGRFALQLVTKCDEKYEASWMATASIRSRLRWLLDELPPSYTKTGIVSSAPLFEGCRSGLHDSLMRNVKIKHPLHVGRAASSSAAQQKATALQQAIEGLPLSYLMSVALRQIYDMFSMAMHHCSADEFSSKPIPYDEYRKSSMSPGSGGAVFEECDDIILPDSANRIEAPPRRDIRKLLSIYCSDILGDSGVSDLSIKQHASQAILGAEEARLFLKNIMSTPEVLSTAERNGIWETIEKFASIVNRLGQSEDMHFSLLSRLSDLVCLIDSTFFEDDILQRAVEARLQRTRGAKGSDDCLSSMEDTGYILNFPEVSVANCD